MIRPVKIPLEESLLLLALCMMASLCGEPREDGVSVLRDAVPVTEGTESWLVVSPYQSGTNAVEVLTPTKLEPGRCYPVVYCLPVNAGTKGQWGHPLAEASRLGLADRYQAIFVTPSYAILPWYGNNPGDPLCRQNDHLLKAVLPFIGSHYPVNGTNYLVGFSKSALGVLSLAMEHRETFAGVAVFENWYGEPDARQWETWGFRPCYGTRENYDLHEPSHLIAAHAAEWTNGPAAITVLGGGPGARVGVEQLMGELTRRGIPHAEIWDRSMSHRWDSGWLSLAVASLFRDTTVSRK